MQKICFILLIFGFITACSSDNTKTTNPETAASGSVVIKDRDAADTKITEETEFEDSEPAGPNYIIEPGKSVGLIKLDEQAQVIYKLLGNPAKSDAAMGKMLATWFSSPGITKPDSVRYVTNIFFSRNLGKPDPESQAKQIRVTSPEYRLPNRLGVNSTLETIKDYYPDLKKVAVYSGSGGKTTVYHAVNAGIAFEIDANNRCQGIAIQEPGEQNYEVYTAVSNDLKKL